MEHRFFSAIALAAAGTSLTENPRDKVLHAATAYVGGFCLGTLPDIVEPATSPHHRQFFHSIAFATLLGFGMYKLYKWDPKTPKAEIFRLAGLIAGGAYLFHLALDATTKRSLPMIGRIE
jgi:membrane-bound metal-dependent hydrolase YbcI (DUF457 family)